MLEVSRSAATREVGELADGVWPSRNKRVDLGGGNTCQHVDLGNSENRYPARAPVPKSAVGLLAVSASGPKFREMLPSFEEL